jgi:hypothetical protein
MTPLTHEQVRAAMLVLANEATHITTLRDFARCALLVRGALTMADPPTPAADHARKLLATWAEVEPMLREIAEGDDQ